MKSLNLKAREDRKGFTTTSDYQKARLNEWLKEFTWFSITPLVRESKQQRGFYHAAVCALYAYFHDKLDHHSHEDIETVHNWLKSEFNGEYVTITVNPTSSA